MEGAPCAGGWDDGTFSIAQREREQQNESKLKEAPIEVERKGGFTKLPTGLLPEFELQPQTQVSLAETKRFRRPLESALPKGPRVRRAVAVS